MRRRRLKITEKGVDAVYHCMTRTVNGEHLFKDRDKERLRKMLWQVADFSGVEILTYCLMNNHFHVLVYVPYQDSVPDAELLRRYRVLYPKPTAYETASIKLMEKTLAQNGHEAAEIRKKLLARMGDVSQFMKTLKQRFSIWFNHHHERFGTLWAERFKSVLVEGEANPLQTMAAYIDLNPVRAGLVADPKDYRFCGYAEAVAGRKKAIAGLQLVWSAFDPAGGTGALAAHRMLLFGKGAVPKKQGSFDREKALQVLEVEHGELSKSELMRCRVRYFSDGAILGSKEFVASFVDTWQKEKRRKNRPKVHPMRGGNWGGLSVIQGLRRRVFG
ncbi:MAG: transposase [Verrucomicrobia bacterium]|jgi:REP element-mobilizing transposase RayT|nr:transposase [Verrucomicrobiota bacterium]